MEQCNEAMRCALRAIRMIVTDDYLVSAITSSTPATTTNNETTMNAVDMAA